MKSMGPDVLTDKIVYKMRVFYTSVLEKFIIDTGQMIYQIYTAM